MKPFDLEAALSGNPVRLRNGKKAFVIGVAPDSIRQATQYPIVGFSGSDYLWESICWTSDCRLRIGRESELDIVGMWEPEKPSIDWSHVNPKYKWLAVDQNESVYLYTLRPVFKGGIDYWWVNEEQLTANSFLINGLFASFKRGDCDWKDSLIRRPEND